MKRKISLFILIICALFCVLSFKTKAIIGTYKILEYNVDIYTNEDTSLEVKYNIKYQVLDNYGYPINGFSIPVPEGYYLTSITFENNSDYSLDLNEGQEISALSQISIIYSEKYGKNDIIELKFVCVYDTGHYDNEYHTISYWITDKTTYSGSFESYCINWHTDGISKENIVYNNANEISDNVYTWSSQYKSDYDYIEIAMEFSKEAFPTYTFYVDFNPVAFNIAVILFYIWFFTVPAIIIFIIIFKKNKQKKNINNQKNYYRNEKKDSKNNDEFSIDQSQYEISDEDF